MRQLLVLLFILASDLPAWSEGAGAKAMFKDPSLNVISFSPSSGETAKQDRREPVDSSRPSQPTRPEAQGGLAPKTEEVRSIGIRSWVQRVNARGEVLAKMGSGHVFRSGEKIQLVVESNTEGYLAIVQQGSDGRAGLLFPPQESKLGVERIPAHSKIVLPDVRHAFTFDREAGTERLLIVLARDRNELEALPLRREMTLLDFEAVRRVAARELGAKNLVIEAFADPQDDPAIYTVNRAGNAIVQELALVHEE